jgi:hypothetical protein
MPVMGEAYDKTAAREDFALTNVPADGGRRPLASLVSALFGIPSALVFFSVGGALGEQYGATALVTGVAVASVIIGIATWHLTRFAAHTGLDSDLMSIVAGFGRRGSAVTSLIYSANFFVLFALEDGIVASAIQSRYPGLPKVTIFIALGLIVLAASWRGIGRIARAMLWTLPLFGVLLVIAVVRAARNSSHEVLSLGLPAHTVSATAWLSVLAALLAFIVNATVAADVGRFLPVARRRSGPIVIAVALQLASLGAATLLGAWFATHRGGDTNPGSYLVGLLGGWGLLCVITSQGRINVINAYSGSLSLSNFGLRGAGVHPGRHVWLLVMVATATLLAMTNIYQHLVGVLTFESVFVMAWVAILVTYILTFDVEREVSPQDPLRDAPAVNLVGLCALCVALASSVPLAFGAAGDLGTALAPLVSAGAGGATVAGIRLVLGRRRSSSLAAH